MEEQLHALRTGTFAPDVARHVELLRSTDLLVMVQPLWWFSLPAMAKGWIDRVFVNGLAYEYPGYEPWTGPLDHVRAMAVFTSSYEREEFEPGGRAGPVEAVLHPLLWGTFAYCGMQVLEAFIAYAADSVGDATREGYLAALRERLVSVRGGQPSG
jgi:NAD(P)H dehydrogenase (quinone)